MPHTAVTFSARDLALLDTLTQRVRVLSVDQVARTWFDRTADPSRHARRSLARLEGLGMLQRFAAWARPELRLRQPLVVWEPGSPTPIFSGVATQLAARWSEPAVRTEAVIATRAAGNRMGGYGGRMPRRAELSHDLCLAGLYLMLTRRDPGLRDRWWPEARLAERGFGKFDKLPDALVNRDAGNHVIIEMGGEYSARKLASFHAFCARHEVPYEIW